MALLTMPCDGGAFVAFIKSVSVGGGLHFRMKTNTREALRLRGVVGVTVSPVAIAGARLFFGWASLVRNAQISSSHGCVICVEFTSYFYDGFCLD